MKKSRKPATAVQTPDASRTRTPSWWTLGLVVALVGVTLLVYAPVRHFDFVEIDDPVYVRENPHVAAGLTWEGVSWAFTSVHAAYWLPLTWVSYMADVEVFGGVDAGGHHVTNLILHITNTLLLFGLLRRTTGSLGRSAFVAALFAVHPLHVESVAWITERKDVLSTLFWMLTMWAYVWYVRKPGWRRYACVVTCMALGLMAKPMLVTLPFVLLLLDVWPLNRATLSRGAPWSQWKPLVVEKLPLFLVTIAASVIAFLAQEGGGAATTFDALPLGMRLQNGAVSYVAYLGQMFWPSGLAVFYPLPPSIPAWTVVGALLVLALVTVLVIRAARRHPYLLVGWFWYLGTMMPVIGLVQVGLQARADRFTYVPLIGVFLMGAWGVWDLAGRSRSARTAVTVAALVVVAASGVQARSQLGYWRDSVTLWTRAVEGALGLGNFQAHVALGQVLRDQGRFGEALGHYQEAIRLRPTSADAQHNLGLVLMKLGRSDEALSHFMEAVRAKPDMAEARSELGLLLSRQGRVDEAIAEYAEAVRLNPELPEVHNNLGVLLAQQARLDEALVQFAAAVQQRPDFETARVNLGLALAKTGRLDEALREFQAVLLRNPQHALARQAVDQLSRH
jgi:Flp pilus assembly protein TadD